MKNPTLTILTILLITLISTTLFSQVPQKLDFQAIARDAEGVPIASQDIGVKISIVKDSIGGVVVYEQEDTLTTDISGLFTLKIGEGNVTTGNFSEINWGENSHYTQVSVDKDGGTNYINMGTMEMVSVPYALFARNTDSWSVNYDTTSTMKRVGIGTSSPGTILHIYSDDPDISLDITSSSAFNNAELRFRKDGETKSRIYFNKNDSVLHFENNGSNSIRLNKQNVGIGTSNPRGRLDINSGNSATDALYVKSSGGVADQGGIIHYQNESNPYAWQVVTKYNIGESGALSFHYVDNNDPSQKINPNVLVLRNGRVGIGTSNPSSKLTVVGLTGASSGYTGLLYSSASGTIFYQNDSKENMNNVNLCKNDFSSILHTKPKEYIDKTNGHRNIGFIAEDFDELGLKDLVIYNENEEPEAIKYDKISLYLVEVIKDQQKEIEELKSRMAEIEKLK